MVRYRRTFSMMARLLMFVSPLLSRGRICGTTIFDSLAGREERTCGFRTVDGASLRVDTAQLFGERKPGRFNLLCAPPGARPENSHLNRRRSSGRTRRLHQAPMRAASCGRSMPVRRREVMRTPAWPRTAIPFVFVAVMMAGWLRRPLTFGSNWTLSESPLVNDAFETSPGQSPRSHRLVMLVLCTRDATDRGSGIFLDVVDDL